MLKLDLTIRPKYAAAILKDTIAMALRAGVPPTDVVKIAGEVILPWVDEREEDEDEL